MRQPGFEVQQSDEVLFDSCRVLFGDQVELSERFLTYLQLSGLKCAYRQRAKERHPDLGHGEGLFCELSESYERLLKYLKERDREKQAKTARWYEGPVPSRPLEIGLYLFYRGVISSDQLFDAIRWQRKQRPPLGEIARKWGWLKEDQIRQTLVARGAEGRFGERCVALGLLTRQQVRTLVFYQRRLQRRIGEYFVEKGFLQFEELENLAGEFHFHNSRLNFR